MPLDEILRVKIRVTFALSRRQFLVTAHIILIDRHHTFSTYLLFLYQFPLHIYAILARPQILHHWFHGLLAPIPRPSHQDHSTTLLQPFATNPVNSSAKLDTFKVWPAVEQFFRPKFFPHLLLTIRNVEKGIANSHIPRVRIHLLHATLTFWVVESAILLHRLRVRICLRSVDVGDRRHVTASATKHGPKSADIVIVHNIY